MLGRSENRYKNGFISMKNIFKQKIVTNTFFLFVIIAFTVSCFRQNLKKHPSEIDFTKLPYKTLSEYGFFEGKQQEMKPNEGVLFYEPAASLFTDYAFKKRFVWMPKGVSATFDEAKPNASLNFPDKTILIKNFYYPADFSKPEAEKRILETRLLVKNNGQWQAFPYRWNEAQTDAQYKITGEQIAVAWKDEKGEKHAIKYAMPNKNQCKSCHNQNGVFMPIGPKLKQLNHAISYNQIIDNQLDKWIKVGYLKGKIDKSKINNLVSINDPKAPLDQKARSYLDVNCGHCHSTEGPAASSGLRLNIEENNPYHWGVKKSPVAAGIGAGTFLYDIYPEHGDESILTFRMNSTNPGIMMPEIGRVSIHKEGVELIKNWINSLKNVDKK
jgi:uncharacterized repeat protein (TIGR03806 family)